MLLHVLYKNIVNLYNGLQHFWHILRVFSELGGEIEYCLVIFSPSTLNASWQLPQHCDYKMFLLLYIDDD